MKAKKKPTSSVKTARPLWFSWMRNHHRRQGLWVLSSTCTFRIDPDRRRVRRPIGATTDSTRMHHRRQRQQVLHRKRGKNGRHSWWMRVGEYVRYRISTSLKMFRCCKRLYWFRLWSSGGNDMIFIGNGRHGDVHVSHPCTLVCAKYI